MLSLLTARICVCMCVCASQAQTWLVGKTLARPRRHTKAYTHTLSCGLRSGPQAHCLAVVALAMRVIRQDRAHCGPPPPPPPPLQEHTRERTCTSACMHARTHASTQITCMRPRDEPPNAQRIFSRAALEYIMRLCVCVCARIIAAKGAKEAATTERSSTKKIPAPPP